MIGITGAARAGKDTVADLLLKRLPGYSKLSFADPMKEMLAVGLKLSHEQLYGHLKEVVDHRYGKTPREMMQTIGTEWGREMVHPDVWCNALKARAGSATVEADVRFENEAALIREHGVLIAVHRDGVRTDSPDHISEKGIKPVPGDFSISNNGSLASLEMKVDGIVKRITQLRKGKDHG